GRRLQERHGRGDQRLVGAPPQPQPLRAVAQIDLAEVMLGHQSDEGLDRPHVEGAAGFRYFVGHRVLLNLWATILELEAQKSRKVEGKSRGRLVRSSAPSGVTRMSSSRRMPPQPGK